MSDWRWNPGIEGINDRKETEDLWDWEKGKIKIRRGDEERGSRGDSREDLPGSRLRNRILGKYQRSGDDMDRFVCIITESQQIKGKGLVTIKTRFLFTDYGIQELENWLAMVEIWKMGLPFLYGVVLFLISSWSIALFASGLRLGQDSVQETISISRRLGLLQTCWLCIKSLRFMDQASSLEKFTKQELDPGFGFCIMFLISSMSKCFFFELFGLFVFELVVVVHIFLCDYSCVQVMNGKESGYLWWCFAIYLDRYTTGFTSGNIGTGLMETGIRYGIEENLWNLGVLVSLWHHGTRTRKIIQNFMTIWRLGATGLVGTSEWDRLWSLQYWILIEIVFLRMEV